MNRVGIVGGIHYAGGESSCLRPLVRSDRSMLDASIKEVANLRVICEKRCVDDCFLDAAFAKTPSGMRFVCAANFCSVVLCRANDVKVMVVPPLLDRLVQGRFEWRCRTWAS